MNEFSVTIFNTMSYYPTEEEEFELMCDDELEIEREIEHGMYKWVTWKRLLRTVFTFYSIDTDVGIKWNFAPTFDGMATLLNENQILCFFQKTV